MDNQEYYFITVFERLELDHLGWPKTGARRTWGFYNDKDVALKALHTNNTDMQETIYDYATLEGYEEGISNITGYRQFFKYDKEKDGYFEIDIPEGYEHFIGFGLG